MAGLRLGPLLRYVDWETGSTATVWVEADRPTTAEVRCADGASGSSRTFAIAGHHYALVVVTGLTPDSTTAYEVLLDGRRVWPLKDSGFPASTITTPPAPADDTGERPVRISFGSCRWAAPPPASPTPPAPTPWTPSPPGSPPTRAPHAPTYCSCSATRCTPTRYRRRPAAASPHAGT